MALTIEEPVFAAIETGGYGVAETLAGTDAMLIVGDPPNFDALANSISSDRNAVRALTNAKLASRFGGAAPTITFTTELKHSGTIDTPPKLGRFLRACGMVETINAATSVVYTLRANNTTYESLTVGHWKGGVRYLLAGGRGTFRIIGEIGNSLLIEFTITFASLAKSDTTQLTPTYDSSSPVIFMANNFFTLGGANPALTTFGLDMQQENPVGRNANASDGIGIIRVGSRQIQVTVNPQKDTLATKDWLADVYAGSSSALSMVLGTANGNRVTVATPKLIPTGLGFGDAEGLRTEELTFVAEDNSSVNDELTITFD